MAIIAYTWTTVALLSGVKRRTRRTWDDEYAARFRSGYRMEAWDRSPKYGGLFLGNILLTEKPYRQNTGEMTEHDYELEGLAWMEQQGLLIRKQNPRVFFDNWRRENESVYVVDFQPLSLISLDRYLDLRGGADHRFKSREPAKQERLL